MLRGHVQCATFCACACTSVLMLGATQLTPLHTSHFQQHFSQKVHMNVHTRMHHSRPINQPTGSGPYQPPPTQQRLPLPLRAAVRVQCITSWRNSARAGARHTPHPSSAVGSSGQPWFNHDSSSPVLGATEPVSNPVGWQQQSGFMTDPAASSAWGAAATVSEEGHQIALDFSVRAVVEPALPEVPQGYCSSAEWAGVGCWWVWWWWWWWEGWWRLDG